MEKPLTKKLNFYYAALIITIVGAAAAGSILDMANTAYAPVYFPISDDPSYMVKTVKEEGEDTAAVLEEYDTTANVK